MSVAICIFESPGYQKLLPLVWFRPVFDLRCGIVTLRDKIQAVYGNAPVTVHCRPYLAEVCREATPGTTVNVLPAEACLFLDARLVAGEETARLLDANAAGSRLYRSRGTIVAARLEGGPLAVLRRRAESEAAEGLDLGVLLADQSLSEVEVAVDLVEYPWHLIERNGREISRDAARFLSPGGHSQIHGAVHPSVVRLEEDRVYVGENAVVDPGVVLDARHGPVVIGPGARIESNAFLQGPVSVAERAVIRPHARILRETTIGPVCKIAGEVAESIVHGYTNKQHHGFLGHTYLGEWVNLGAGTTTSDLKNTYGEVSVELEQERVATGSQFVGLFMGDHSKSGINAAFNTGTMVGVCCNLLGTALLPKFVPSFSWGGAEGFETYDYARSIEVARRAMQRRDRELTPAMEGVFTEAFRRTEAQRTSYAR